MSERRMEEEGGMLEMSHMTQTGSCKMITMELELMTSSESLLCHCTLISNQEWKSLVLHSLKRRKKKKKDIC